MMPKVARELTPMAVKQLRHPGPPRTSNVVLPVGGVSGLLIQITPSNAKSWIVRTMVGTKRREIGLGSYPEISLGQARIDATDEKRKIKAGIDPVAERKENRLKIIAQQKRGLTFKAATERYLSNNKIESFRNDKHKRQWRSTLEQYANTAIGDMLVSDIGVDDIKRTLASIWNENVTAKIRRCCVKNRAIFDGRCAVPSSYPPKPVDDRAIIILMVLAMIVACLLALFIVVFGTTRFYTFHT